MDKTAREKTRADRLQEAEAAAGEANGGKIVIYTTSVQAVQRTYSNCQEMRKIFQRARVPFEDRNVAFSSQFVAELAERLPGAEFPQAFFNGQHLGVCQAGRKGNKFLIQISC